MKTSHRTLLPLALLLTLTFLLAGCQKPNEVPPPQKSVEGLRIKLPDPRPLTPQEEAEVQALQQAYDAEVRH